MKLDPKALAEELLQFMNATHRGQPTVTVDANEMRTLLEAFPRRALQPSKEVRELVERLRKQAPAVARHASKLNCWPGDNDFEDSANLMMKAADLLSRMDGEGWRPIETAPKGRQVLAGYRNELGNWRTIKACYYLAGTLDADDSCDDADADGYAPEGWYEESETHDYILPCQQPTHWRPLPPSPSIEDPTQGSPAGGMM